MPCRTCLVSDLSCVQTHPAVCDKLSPSSRKILFPEVAVAESCSKVLEQGLFDREMYRTSAEYKRDVELLLYKSEFRTHDEANRAGFGLGFPIYGFLSN